MSWKCKNLAFWPWKSTKRAKKWPKYGIYAIFWGLFCRLIILGLFREKIKIPLNLTFLPWAPFSPLNLKFSKHHTVILNLPDDIGHIRKEDSHWYVDTDQILQPPQPFLNQTAPTPQITQSQHNTSHMRTQVLPDVGHQVLQRLQRVADNVFVGVSDFILVLIKIHQKRLNHSNEFRQKRQKRVV